MKYDVKMACGHVQTVDLYGKTKERERRIAYFEDFGMCTECFKKWKAEQEEKKGFLFKVSVNPRINGNTGDIEFTVWFEGDTKPHKDEIKALGGYRWGEKTFSQVPWKQDPFCWSKTIKEDQLKEEIEKAKSIGAEFHYPQKGTQEGAYFMAGYQDAQESHNRWIEKQEMKKELKKEMVPQRPDIIAGKRWNGKVYGKEGNRTIYLDGEPIKIEDSLAAELEEYYTKYTEYLKKAEEIEAQYRSRISQYK